MTVWGLPESLAHCGSLSSDLSDVDKFLTHMSFIKSIMLIHFESGVHFLVNSWFEKTGFNKTSLSAVVQNQQKCVMKHTITNDCFVLFRTKIVFSSALKIGLIVSAGFEMEKMKMMRFPLLGTKTERIRKENFRDVAHVRCSGGETREACPTWVAQVKGNTSHR